MSTRFGQGFFLVRGEGGKESLNNVDFFLNVFFPDKYVLSDIKTILIVLT